jgi:hypothetical protein
MATIDQMSVRDLQRIVTLVETLNPLWSAAIAIDQSRRNMTTAEVKRKNHAISYLDRDYHEWSHHKRYQAVAFDTLN